MSEKKVRIDSENCISCWACVAMCPNVFGFDESKRCYVKKQPDDSEWPDVIDSESACPMWVIIIED